MAVIGDLATIMSVNSSGLTTGLTTGAKSVTGFAGSIGSLAGKIAPLGAAIGGVVSAVKGISEIGQAFGEIDRIAKFSAQTGIATDELVGLEHAANLSGVSISDLQRAQQRALREGFAGGIAEIADQMAALESPVEKAQFAYEAMGRSGQNLIPLLQLGGDAIRGMVDEGKQLAGFSGVDAAKVEAANDAIARMKLSFTGIARDIAIGLAPVVDGIATRVKNLGIAGRETFNEWLPVIKAVGSAITTGISAAISPLAPLFTSTMEVGGNAFGSIRDFILDTALMAEFAFGRIGDVGLLLWEKLKLGVVSWFEDVKDVFMVKWPAIFTWFADNWQDVFFTAFDYVATGFVNLGQNIRNAMTEIWEFIKSGGTAGLEFTWVPLTEGFVNTIKELPDIGEREIGALEGQLMASVDRISGGLTEGLADHLASRKADLFPAAEEAGEAMAGGIADGLDSAKGPGELGSFGAVQKGSSAAFSAVLSAMRGGTRDPQEAIKMNTDEQVELQRRMARTLERQAKRQPVELVAGSV